MNVVSFIGYNSLHPFFDSSAMNMEEAYPIMIGTVIAGYDIEIMLSGM